MRLGFCVVIACLASACFGRRLASHPVLASLPTSAWHAPRHVNDVITRGPRRSSRATAALIKAKAAPSAQKQQQHSSRIAAKSPRVISSSDIFRSRFSAVLSSATLGLAICVAGLIAAPAFAENELAALADGKFDSSLVDTECIAGTCAAQTKACLENTDCLKGMTCIGKCMGDNACVTGCFAKFGDGTAQVSDFLRCTVEDAECIKINVLPAGFEPAGAIPPPRGTLVKNFRPTTMEGKWYKVMGWNSNYDCFDCQQNTFSRKGATDFSVDVDFSMPRQWRRLVDKPGEEPTPARMRMVENMIFDTRNPLRHAHTEGRLFGLKFWENWAVIGENTGNEPPFKFIYYNGHTRQNSYEGAFVYARTPQLSPAAMESVYRIARNAGLSPEQFCQIRNDACKVQPDANSRSVADIKRLQTLIASAPKKGADILTRIIFAPIDGVHGAGKFAGNLAADIFEFVEDSQQVSKWMLDQQKTVNWGRIAMADEDVVDVGADGGGSSMNT